MPRYQFNVGGTAFESIGSICLDEPRMTMSMQQQIRRWSIDSLGTEDQRNISRASKVAGFPGGARFFSGLECSGPIGVFSGSVFWRLWIIRKSPGMGYKNGKSLESHLEKIGDGSTSREPAS